MMSPPPNLSSASCDLDLLTPKLTISCPSPVDHLCQVASESVQSFSYRVHKFEKQTNEQVKNIMTTRVGQIKRGQCSLFVVVKHVLENFDNFWQVKYSSFTHCEKHKNQILLPEGGIKSNAFICSSILVVFTTSLTHNFCGTSAFASIYLLASIM